MTRTTQSPDAIVSDTDAPTDTVHGESPRPRSRLGLAAVLSLLALGLGSWATWQYAPGLGDWLRGGHASGAAPAEVLEERVGRLQREVEALRESQRQLERRVSDNAARQRVLGEELLGIGERAALLEEGLARAPDAPAATAPRTLDLRLDEAELLLGAGLQRLHLANDREGALRAYALAGVVLSALSDPRYVSLRQVLSQEEAALRALPADPRDQALGELDALEAALPGLDLPVPQPALGQDSRLARVFSRLVEVRPSGEGSPFTPNERPLALTALRLELAMARGALERRDEPAFGAALERIDDWLVQLYADSDALAERRQRLAALREKPLRLELPVLGSTLEQLRQLRAARQLAEEGA